MPAAMRRIARMLEEWMRSYEPETLFDATGRLRPELAALAPTGERRMGANPHANGGLLEARAQAAGLSRLRCRRRRIPAARPAEATRVMGTTCAT